MRAQNQNEQIYSKFSHLPPYDLARLFNENLNPEKLSQANGNDLKALRFTLQKAFKTNAADIGSVLKPDLFPFFPETMDALKDGEGGDEARLAFAKNINTSFALQRPNLFIDLLQCTDINVPIALIKNGVVDGFISESNKQSDFSTKIISILLHHESKIVSDIFRSSDNEDVKELIANEDQKNNDLFKKTFRHLTQ